MTVPEAPPILELRNVRAGYGPIEVVHGVDLAVASGSVMALLGPNGGGKTTMLDVCVGTLAASSGEVCFEGTAVTRALVDDCARGESAPCPKGGGSFPTSACGRTSSWPPRSGSRWTALRRWPSPDSTAQRAAEADGRDAVRG